VALTTGEIESARAILDRTLGEPATASIQERTRTSDGMGGSTETWAQIAAVECRFAPDSGEEALRGGAISAVARGVVTFPAGTEITPEHRLVFDEVIYEVLAVERHSWDLCVRARVEIPDYEGVVV